MPVLDGEPAGARARSLLVGTTAACAALVLVAAPAAATGRHGGGHHHDGGPPVEVVASGLSDPWSVRFDGRGRLVVAENGTGEVTRTSGAGGEQTVLAQVPGLVAADTSGRTVLALTAGPSPAPDAPTLPGAATLSAGRPGDLSPLADLLAHELAANPDGQDQAFADALSNPYSVLAGRGERAPLAYVADGGGNDVLAVAADGTVSTFFVPPTVNTGACAGAENNPGTTGCDSVPTGLSHGPGGKVYVAAFTGGAPGEGRVYVVDRHGKLVREISGFSGPTGVAVGDDGTVYVSEAAEGAPEGDELPPGFDVSTLGRIVAVAPDGRRSAAQVTMPLGLQWKDGALYSTAWSLAGMTPGAVPEGAPPRGEVVRVRPGAFTPL